jgi:CHAT domain-containing protein
MSKKKVTAAETLRMNIELADNGIIIRNPDIEDEVILAMAKDKWSEDNSHHDDEYRAVGKIIYNWLMDVVLQNQDPNEIITTGFQLGNQCKM